MTALAGAAPGLGRRLGAEALGSALLAAVVVGSGIAAQQLSPTDVGLQLLENAAVTAAALPVLVLLLGPVSGAHLNPLVTVADAALGRFARRDVLPYAAAQVLGCCLGTVLANALFAQPLVALSRHHRASGPHLLAEVVATAGLLLVVFGLPRGGHGRAVPAAVGAWIGAAYWFTSSTSFANPAITLGRSLSDTFAGIAPSSVPGFVGAQAAGAVVGVALVAGLFPRPAAPGGATPRPEVAVRWAAGPQDLRAARALVAEAGLPLDGHGACPVVLLALVGGQPVGTAALERHGDADPAFLLRSTAVAPAWRGRGAGEALVRAALAVADDEGAPTGLLTETAASWFTRFGFEPVSRGALPASLRASAELQGACPSTAQALLRPAAGRRAGVG